MENKYTQLLEVSDPNIVKKNAQKYFGRPTEIFISSRKDKKYMLHNPSGKLIHFGASKYQDYTKHRDEDRRLAYLQRATKIRGNWRSDPYSPNMLAVNLLWN